MHHWPRLIAEELIPKGGIIVAEASQRKGLCYGYHYHNSIDLKEVDDLLIEAAYLPFDEGVEAEAGNTQQDIRADASVGFVHSHQ